MRTVFQGQTFDTKFTTRAFASGIPTQLAGTPVVDIYEDNSVTQITAAETLTVDFDSVTGLNNLRIAATSGNGFDRGSTYSAVITTGTVATVSVVGEVVAEFRVATLAEVLQSYAGPRGPGVYYDSAAANTNEQEGVDGTPDNPISEEANVTDVCEALGVNRIYLVNGTTFTAAEAMLDYEFVGIGEWTQNTVDLNSNNVGGSSFYNLTLQGTQGDAVRIYAEGCALQDPGAGTTTLNILAKCCGIVDEISIDASADNVFDQCFSLVAGTSAPIVNFTGASGTACFRHWSGGLDIRGLGSSHNVSIEGHGNVIFNQGNNVNATVAIRGVFTLDNTDGITGISDDGRLDTLHISDQVWLETLADHSGSSGSTAEALSNASSAGDPWATALPGAYGAGTAGNILGNNLDAPTSVIDSNVDAILVDTNELQTNQGNWLTATGFATSGALATVDANVDLILADTNELQTNQGNWLTATGFSTHSAADVWTAGTRTLTAGTNLNDLSAAEVNAG